MKISLLRLLIYSSSIIFSSSSYCQEDSLRARYIRELSKVVREQYSDEAVAQRMADKIEAQFSKGVYDTALNMDEFFYLVTKDLRSVCGDDHVSVATPVISAEAEEKIFLALSQKQRRKRMERAKANLKVLRETLKKEALLLGDIKRMGSLAGYLQVLSFNTSHKDYQKCTLGKAASFLSGTDNLIIDLRGNPGGRVRQLSNFISYFTATPGSYLFLSSFQYRYDSSGHQKKMESNDKYYSATSIQRAFFQRRIFVLIDRYTFSAGEATAYLLKKLYPDVTIVGEPTTGGKGSGVGVYPYDNFDANIPNGYLKDEERNILINEGGIRPDVFAHRDSTLEVALELIRGQENSGKQEWKYLRKMAPEKPAEMLYNADRYTGNYLKVIVEKKENELFLIYDKHAPMKLHPKETDVFTTDGFIQKVRFFRTGEGIITGIRIELSKTYNETFLKRPVYKPESVLGWDIKR